MAENPKFDQLGPTGAEARAQNPLAWWTTIAGLLIVIVFGGLFITRAYLERRTYEIKEGRPPLLHKLVDLEATNRDGATVNLHDLTGQVFVGGWQYTDCPSGCIGMAAVMEQMARKFKDHPDFHLVSVSLNPEQDTPEKMDAWVKDHALDEPNWWFLTGDREKIHKYMIRYFKMFGVSKNTDPATIAAMGEYSHDQRLTLVDRNGHLRGHYDVLNTTEFTLDGEETTIGELAIAKLERDIDFLLNEEMVHPTRQ